ncbi:cutinase family protein [Corynebacterium ulceribovis]|uniref:cutinase family protein n=1 Tax=Corynebacterium ulceribovis TaxID=487732 RepID=UPI000382BF62|nr:cutinase family protein [Corynebacterium ulceribovis]
MWRASRILTAFTSAVLASTALVVSASTAHAAPELSAEKGQSSQQPGGREVLPLASERCEPVHIVVTAGTGESNPDDNPRQIRGLGSGINFTQDLLDSFDGISAWQTPYNASAGILSSNGESRAKHFLPYAASKKQAATAITEHLADQKARCPGTSFILAGYSQSADAVGDVLADISAGKVTITPEDIAGAYLLGDPARSDLGATLTPTAKATSSGSDGIVTTAGAVLIPLDQGLPRKTSHGLTGNRPDGAFANLPGKVRQLCAKDDKACAVLPDEPSARIGAHASRPAAVHPDYYSAVSLKQMQANGSFARAIGSHATALMAAITFGDLVAVKKQFERAARTPGLTKGERATLRLTGVELAELMGSARIKIPERHVTGVSDVDRVIDVLDSLADSDNGLGKLGEIRAFPEAHGAYTGNEGKAATIGGVRVDQWIAADMAALATQHGARTAK